MITAYIWGAGGSGKVFAFWGWAEMEPQGSRAPHIVCGWAAQKTEAPRNRYLLCQGSEARKVEHAPVQYKAHADTTQAVKCADALEYAGKSARSAGKASVTESGRESVAKAIDPKIKSTSNETERVFKVTNK